MDKDIFEQTKAIHNEFLQGMRGTEDSAGFFLKPVVKSKNRLLVNRQRVNGTTVYVYLLYIIILTTTKTGTQRHQTTTIILNTSSVLYSS